MKQPPKTVLNDLELEAILADRVAELARELKCRPADLSAIAHHVLQNLLLDGVRIGKEREAYFDPDKTPVTKKRAAAPTVKVDEPQTLPGFRRRKR